MDGVGGLTQEPIAPGRPLRIPVHAAGAGNLPHPALRPRPLAEPLERGLSAVLVVEEDDPPRVDHEFVLLVDDWLLAEDGSLVPFGGPDAGGGPARQPGSP